MNVMDTKEQRRIGNQAKKMLSSSLLVQIRLNRLNKTEGIKRINKDGQDVSSLTNARAESRMRRGNLASIAVVMPKHGFIHHFGANGNRKGGTVHRTQPQSTFYQRKAHNFTLRSTPFLNASVQQSGAVQYVSTELGKLAADTIVENIKFN